MYIRLHSVFVDTIPVTDISKNSCMYCESLPNCYKATNIKYCTINTCAALKFILFMYLFQPYIPCYNCIDTMILGRTYEPYLIDILLIPQFSFSFFLAL